MSEQTDYIPALNRSWLTPLYDPVMKWVVREWKFKSYLVEQVDIRSGQSLLDLGCGTGTLMLHLKARAPSAWIAGLDVDRQVLRIAAAKANRRQRSLSLLRGMAFHLPYDDDTFDHIISSLLFHHLTSSNKQRALHEAYRVLRPGGSLYLMDVGVPHTRTARWIAYAIRHFEEVADNIDGKLATMMQRAGFQAVVEQARFMTLVGTISLLIGYKANNRQPIDRHEQGAVDRLRTDG